jgi:lysophospholipase L1-like esterase
MFVYVFGDSHSKYFQLTKQVKNVYHYPADLSVKVMSFKGATVSGFGKRESTLNVKLHLKDIIKEEQPDHICLNFGQVDLELGYFYKKYVKSENVNFEDFVSKQVTTYLEFVKELSNVIPCVVKGLNLPALCFDSDKAINYTKRIITENIADPVVAGKVLSKMKANFPSDYERTQMLLHYNNILKSSCEKEGIPYFDINDSLKNNDSGLLDIKFIPANRDHHIVDSLQVRHMHISKLINSILKYQIMKHES